MANIPQAYGEEFEFQLLKMIAEEIQNSYLPGSIFRPGSKLRVLEKFRAKCRQNYPYFFLKFQLTYLKRRYVRFSKLLNEEGMYWKKENNIVYGNMDILRAKYKDYLRDGVYVGEKNFELMCQIFESGVHFV